MFDAEIVNMQIESRQSNLLNPITVLLFYFSGKPYNVGIMVV